MLKLVVLKAEMPAGKSARNSVCCSLVKEVCSTPWSKKGVLHFVGKMEAGKQSVVWVRGPASIGNGVLIGKVFFLVLDIM